MSLGRTRCDLRVVSGETVMAYGRVPVALWSHIQVKAMFSQIAYKIWSRVIFTKHNSRHCILFWIWHFPLMAKRSERSTSSSSTESPPSRRFKNNEMVNEKYSKPSVSLSHLLDKVNYLDKRLEDLFGNLSTELSTLRYELKEEIVGVKNNMAEMEKSVETAWAVIGEIQT